MTVTMNDTQTQQIRQLLPALKALEKSINQTGEEVQAAAATIAVKTYNALHQRAAEALPDDVYVTEALRLDLAQSHDERGQLAQVQIAVAQLIPYLKGLLTTSAQNDTGQAGSSVHWMDDLEDLKDLSRSLRDNILEQTRNTLRRAFADIEINIDTDLLPKQKRRVHISHEDDSSYRNANLSGQHLNERDFSNADLRKANLSGAHLRNANLKNADLRNANLSGAHLNEADLSNADLRNANLTGASLAEARFFSADLHNASLSGANLSSADLTNADLRDVDLSGANLTNAQVYGIDLRGAVLPDGSAYHSAVDLARYGARQDSPPETDE